MLPSSRFLVLALALVSFPAFSQTEQEPPIQNPGPIAEKCDRSRPIESRAIVERGVDGDTVYVRAPSGTYKVRMIGIDTPETFYKGESQGEWGERAKERLKELLPPGTAVQLELSPSVCDGYGRVLAHVFAGKKHVNKELVREGLAVNYCLYPSVAHCEELGELTEQAMARRIGMFSDPQAELPYDFRRRIDNREQFSFTGNLRTKEVYRPGHQERVPVGARIFFFRETSIKPPYYLAH